MLGRSLILKTAAWKPVERLVRRSFLFRPLVRRFIAGDTLEEAMTHAEKLAERGLATSLDYLGENTLNETEALAAKATYIAMLERIARSPHRDRINISIKLTQCGLDQGESFAERNFREVLTVAAKTDTFVRVDMESSDYTERTIAMIERVFPDHPNTGTVLQSYLYRTPDDAERLIRLGCRVRIVKGAYLEPETVAFKEKSRVDEAYIEIAKQLMSRGRYPAIATHDAKIIDALKAYAKAEGIDRSRFEFQMLYGIRRDLQDGLRDEGYPVRVYVPFGDMWYPYFTRRLAERPANAFFILKSLFKG
ncbi:MAG TPA: proline dehydrogenase family protein [Fimbriimonadaceae bacterium]|nr:proline dehydrogenase family protein [Fimbriimonadaceae bacterium]